MTSPGTQPPATVGTAMHVGVVTCRPDETLRTVAALLAEHHIHAVVVTAHADDGGPCSVVTDRDVVLGYARGNLDRLTARDAASEPTITVRADLDLRYASEMMAQNGTTHIVVTAPGDGTPIGILSSLDIARTVGTQVDG
jgi:CBS domain-containing protein